LAIVVPFESRSAPSVDRLAQLVRLDMERVNNTILTRIGSQVAMIPEVANHLISSGGKRLRPMLTVAMARLAELFAAACEVGPALATRPKDEQAACRSFGMNLGVAFQLVDDALDYGGKAAKLGKNVGDDFREGKITLPVVLSYRRGSETERAFWRRALEEANTTDADLQKAVHLMTKHRALEDTIQRACHYGAIATDALALFPPSPMKEALEEAVEFCICRSN
jgi:octaprenyl-diphosphate synthase